MQMLQKLEIHVAHKCTLSCESCSHFSNSPHSGMLGIDGFVSEVKPWSQRLLPNVFDLLGGEPTLNPQLSQLVMLAKLMFPNSTIQVSSNGSMLHKHTDLGMILGHINGRLVLTKHIDNEAWTRALEIAEGWQADYKLRLELRDGTVDCTRRYHGWHGNIMPYTDNDQRLSWETCSCKRCRQIFEGRLWKCSPLVYIHLQKRRFPQLSSAWDTFLAYRGLPITCSDDELKTFMEEEDIVQCSLCPAHYETFIPLQKP